MLKLTSSDYFVKITFRLIIIFIIFSDFVHSQASISSKEYNIEAKLIFAMPYPSIIESTPVSELFASFIFEVLIDKDSLDRRYFTVFGQMKSYVIGKKYSMTLRWIKMNYANQSMNELRPQTTCLRPLEMSNGLGVYVEVLNYDEAPN